MDIIHINQHLISGDYKHPGVLPHYEELLKQTFQFEYDFGLDELPEEPGIIIIRGPRQYGKSTWLELNIAKTIKNFGEGTALYLNGDDIPDFKELQAEIRELIPLFNPKAKVKRLFIDEISAVKDWVKAIKRLSDAGELREVLLITTGSKATDLLRGTERLPGRKGKLARTNYIFTPISYSEFKSKCEDILGKDTLWAYLLSGGSPIAACELTTNGRLPEYVTSLTSDWLLGEFAASGRARANLLNVLHVIYRFTGNPVGQSKLARESGLSNNSVAEGYTNLLQDLMCLLPAFPIDQNTNRPLLRKPCKYHFTNMLVAMTFHPHKPRTVNDLKELTLKDGAILEWAVAQELFRRECITSAEEIPEYLLFWQSKTNEVDFVEQPNHYIEVKRGKETPVNFKWFLNSHPQSDLTVINQSSFDTESIHGVTLEEFLLKS